MKIRVALQLLLAAAVPLGLAACMDAGSSQRPRLLANDDARVGDLNWVETVTEPDQLGEMIGVRIDVRMMSCAPVVDGAKTPRLVIGEPVCTSGAMIETVRRID